MAIEQQKQEMQESVNSIDTPPWYGRLGVEFSAPFAVNGETGTGSPLRDYLKGQEKRRLGRLRRPLPQPLAPFHITDVADFVFFRSPLSGTPGQEWVYDQ